MRKAVFKAVIEKYKTWDEESPFGRDTRPQYNCYREGHPGPFVGSIFIKGTICRDCYQKAQKHNPDLWNPSKE